jgi:DNA transposition AAA+ family ATPase
MTDHRDRRTPAEGALPPQAADHFRRLEGASACGTLAARETEEYLTEAIRGGSILCIHGHVGLGKTFSVHTALRKHAPDTTVRLVFDEAPKKSELLEALWRALALPGPMGSAAATKRLIRQSLIAQPRVVLIDEVQNLNSATLEYLRILWDEAAMPLVLVGSGKTRQKVFDHPALHSRVEQWQQFKPLTLADVLNFIPVYHPVWEGISDQTLAFVNDTVARGVFRNWAKITLGVQRAQRRDPDRKVDIDLIRWIISRLDSTDRYPGPPEDSTDRYPGPPEDSTGRYPEPPQGH